MTTVTEPGWVDEMIMPAPSPAESIDGNASDPPPPPRRKPGPAPNPNSARQRKRARTAAAPSRRATPAKAATPPPTQSVYERGAITVIGWVARPVAMAGLGLGLAAAAAPEGRRAERLAKLGMALSLDVAVLDMHGSGLARGMAQIAEHVPFAAAMLTRAAQISPYAAALESATTILLQVLCNHGLVPATPMLGTLTPEQLAQAVGMPVEPVGEPAAA